MSVLCFSDCLIRSNSIACQHHADLLEEMPKLPAKREGP